MAKAQDIALYITVCCIAFIISKTIIAVLCYQRWKKKHLVHEGGFSGGKMVMFKSAVLQSLTSDMFLKKTLKLSNKDIIGSGGYGTVYRLTLNDSMAFAVKRLYRGSAERDRGFERELEAMGDIKHRNIVTLHGYYTAPHYNLLIYELMPNGSLDAVLHGRSNDQESLDWPSRYKVALGAARGISYLHHDCIPHIIHRDIKSKYFETGKATVKGDVYSFGVVLLELLTGKKPTDDAFFEEGTKLVTWVKAVVGDEREAYALDKRLKYGPIKEINNMFRIAMMCLEPEPTKRPTMIEIVQMLERAKSEKVAFDC
ncbi:ATP binding protein, putative [Ricinus communis]|uniref:ATP binding protein, putative n=1 Tax=Ricinus communis TaxID=3988 RepID=B9SR67_RICCO|nr:ATP binding protein, putative [Ricinus communis]